MNDLERELEQKLAEQYDSTHANIVYQVLYESWISQDNNLFWVLLYEAIDKDVVHEYRDEVITVVENIDDKKLLMISVLSLKRLRSIVMNELVKRTFRNNKTYNLQYDKDYIEAVVEQLYITPDKDVSSWFDQQHKIKKLVELTDKFPWKWLVSIISDTELQYYFLLFLIEKNKVTYGELIKENIDLDKLAMKAIDTIFPHGYEQFDIALGKLIINYKISIKMLYNYIKADNNTYAEDFLDKIALDQV